MEDLDRIRTLLQDRRLAIVARATGLTRQYLWYIREGHRVPSDDVQRRLIAYFKETSC